MKKRVLLLAFFAACAILLCSCSADKTAEIIGTVNDEKVTAEEMSYFKNRLRASVITKFVNDGAEFSSDFWSKDIGGTTPAEYLDSVAFNECVRAKIQLVECRKNAIYDDISFSALKAKAEKFNKDNEGKQTVGISSIDLDAFYTYYIENGALALKGKLAEEGVIRSEADYEECIDSLVKSADIQRNR